MRSGTLKGMQYWAMTLLQARQLEGELEARTSTFAKLCSDYDGSYQGRGEAGLAAEQVCSPTGRLTTPASPPSFTERRL